MDRRSLLFIFLVTLSFLGIRSWYDKKHEERLQEWRQEQSLSDTTEPQAQRSAPAIFDLPMIFMSAPQSGVSQEAPPLLSSEFIREVSPEQVPPAIAFGIELTPSLFALITDEEHFAWPEATALHVLKTHAPVADTPCQLLKVVTPYYALYTRTTSSQETSCIAHAETSKGQQQFLIHALGKKFADPENYEIIEKDATSATGFLFIKEDHTFVPAAVVSREKALWFSDEMPLLEKYGVTLQKAPALKKEMPVQPIHYYCLENEYQQLIFSTEYGSIVEINLPFTSPQHPKSIVRPVAYDAIITEKSPHNAYFPLAYDAMDAKKMAVKRSLGGYYPLLRRSLISDDQQRTVIAKVLPEYQAGMILPPTPTGERTLPPVQYTLSSISPTSISFRGVDEEGRVMTKTYAFPKDQDAYPYCIDVEISTAGKEHSNGDYLLTTGVPEVEWMSGTNGASVGMLLSKNAATTFERLDLPKDRYASQLQSPDWIMNSNGFFALLLKPMNKKAQGIVFEKVSGVSAPSRLVQLTDTSFNEESLPGYDGGLVMKRGTTQTTRIYAGPLDDVLFAKIDEASQKDFGRSFDFDKALTYQGWFTFISEPFARFLYFFMKQFHRLFGSWALSIVFATVLLRVLLYPLNSWSMKSMQKMQEISPMIKAIQERQKKDPMRAQQEIMALYKEKGVNPFSGCLPLLIQMPFLIGMFDLLKSTFALRGASFIPGWINDLSAPDTLFQLPFSIPFLGNEFHLLPILLGAVMWVQQAVSSSLPKDPSTWTDQQRQQRAMGMMMTVMMTVMFYNFPSGLNIYWISSMALGIAQQWWTTRKGMREKA